MSLSLNSGLTNNRWTIVQEILRIDICNYNYQEIGKHTVMSVISKNGVCKILGGYPVQHRIHVKIVGPLNKPPQ